MKISEGWVNPYRFFNYWEFVYDKFSAPIDIQPIYLGLFGNIGIVFYLKSIF